jgi:hypothetical protein
MESTAITARKLTPRGRPLLGVIYGCPLSRGVENQTVLLLALRRRERRQSGVNATHEPRCSLFHDCFNLKLAIRMPVAQCSEWFFNSSDFA